MPIVQYSAFLQGLRYHNCSTLLSVSLVSFRLPGHAQTKRTQSPSGCKASSFSSFNPLEPSFTVLFTLLRKKNLGFFAAVGTTVCRRPKSALFLGPRALRSLRKPSKIR